MRQNANKFARKRVIKEPKKLFFQVIEYIAFCYNYLVQDNAQGNVYYSQSDPAHNKTYHFEDWLKVRFMEDYLQKQRNNFHHDDVREMRFYSESEKSFTDLDGKIKRDKIDIFITNLNLGSQNYWAKNAVEEDIYFVVECKRLKGNSKNVEYLTDIQKFVERQYKTRFLFTGMIAFIEKSSISIDKIIADINTKLQKHTHITTTQTLTLFPINNFQYCRLSKHEQSFPPHNLIEVYHLFFDYSNIIVP